MKTWMMRSPLFLLALTALGCGAFGSDDDAGTNASGGEFAADAFSGAPQVWTSVQEDRQFATVDVGNGDYLDLKRMRVTADVEGLRARTLVDHVFFNPHEQDLEGTFRYELPAEASVSYYAMYLGAEEADRDVTPEFFGPDTALAALDPAAVVAITPDELTKKDQGSLWGQLREGRIVKAEKALAAYEDVTRAQIDPAVVRQVGPNTFEARVFPIPAQGYNRVLIAYDQTLPRTDGELRYEFPIAEGEVESLDFALSVAVDDAGAEELTVREQVLELERSSSEGAVTYQASHNGKTTAGALAVGMPTGQVDLSVGSDAARDEDFVYARVTPDASAFDGLSGEGANPKAVFLLDTSMSASPDRFGIDVKIFEAILENNASIEQYAVMTFDAGARWLTGGLQENTAANRSSTVDRLDGIVLEGATNFDAALRLLEAASFEVSADEAVDVFVLTDGALNWSATDVAGVVAGHEARRPFDARFFAYRTGLGAENIELFDALTREGATFNCLTAESVDGCSTAHAGAQLPVNSIRLESASGEAMGEELVVAGRKSAIFPEAQLTFAARLVETGAATVVIETPEKTLSLPVELVPSGELAPRAWGEIVTAQLLEPREEKLDALALAYSQYYRILNRVASLLVLETDAEYELYDLESGLAALPESSIVASLAEALTVFSVASDWDRLLRVFDEQDDWHRLSKVASGEVVSEISSTVSAGQLDLPVSGTKIPLAFLSDVPEDYVAARSNEAANQAPFRMEAARRHEAGETGQAVRALSTLVENSPGSSEAARMVAYQLLSWGETELAAALFLDILERRPFEPVSYRDLALALRTSRPALAAMLYEAVLAGEWDERFGQFVTVAQEEYALLASGLDGGGELSSYLDARMAALNLTVPRADLRVTMTWNTDNTDIDLWVTDPKGKKCFYEVPKISSGGELLDDLTGGFGPERFQDVEANDGEYLIQAHYFSNNGNRLSADTHVNALIIRYGGTADEEILYADVLLTEVNEVGTLARVEF